MCIALYALSSSANMTLSLCLSSASAYSDSQHFFFIFLSSTDQMDKSTYSSMTNSHFLCSLRAFSLPSQTSSQRSLKLHFPKFFLSRQGKCWKIGMAVLFLWQNTPECPSLAPPFFFYQIMQIKWHFGVNFFKNTSIHIKANQIN